MEEKTTKKILFLEPQPCIRTLKYAQGLKGGEFEISFGYHGKTLSEFYGMGDNLFLDWIKLDAGNDSQLVDLLNSGNYDVVHSHNAPDYLTVQAINAARRCGKNIPVIQDNHDVLTMRKSAYTGGFEDIGKVSREEMIANQFSDARIHVTEGVKDYVISRYGAKPGFDLVFSNFVPVDLVPINLLPKLSAKDGNIHIAYEGNVDETPTGSHYDLLGIFDSITEQGFHLHIYTPREASNYETLSQKNHNLHFHGRLDPDKLLLELSQYDFGWAGFNDSKNKEHLAVTLANKVMDYISAGLPVITFPHETQMKFVEANKVGVVIDSVDSLEKKLTEDNIEDIKKIVLQRRFDFTVEKNIGHVKKFYDTVLGVDPFKK